MTMLENDVYQAIAEQSALRVQLVSGEVYEGIFEVSTLPHHVTVRTAKGDISLPCWTVKRIHPLRSR